MVNPKTNSNEKKRREILVGIVDLIWSTTPFVKAISLGDHVVSSGYRVVMSEHSMTIINNINKYSE